MQFNTNMFALEPQTQVDTPQNSLAKVLQLQQARQTGELNTLKLDTERRAAADDVQMRDWTQQSGGDMNKLRALAFGGGNYKQGAEIDKRIAEQTKSSNDAAKSKTDLIDARLKQSRAFLDNVNTPEGLIAWQEGNHKDPVLGPALIERGITPELARSSIDKALQTPGGFEDLLKKSALGLEEFTKQNKPTFQTRNLGGTTDTLQIPGMGGAPKVVNSSVNTQSPDSIASNAQSDTNNIRSSNASMSNADATRSVAQATRDAASIQTGFANEQGLRKEFEGLPEVKNYKQAFPAFAAIKDATGRNTTQSDINIVYGLAKLYDPTSVVREGEYATVANSPNIPEKVKGYAQYLQGGGRLSPETKRQILAEATGRIGTYEAEAKKAKGSYEGIAQKRGMNPSSVFADMGDMTGTKAINFGDLK